MPMHPPGIKGSFGGPGLRHGHKPYANTDLRKKKLGFSVFGMFNEKNIDARNFQRNGMEKNQIKNRSLVGTTPQQDYKNRISYHYTYIDSVDYVNGCIEF